MSVARIVSALWYLRDEEIHQSIIEYQLDQLASLRTGPSKSQCGKQGDYEVESYAVRKRRVQYFAVTLNGNASLGSGPRGTKTDTQEDERDISEYKKNEPEDDGAMCGPIDGHPRIVI